MIAVCALDNREEVASAMIEAFAKNEIDSEVFITTVEREDFRVKIRSKLQGITQIFLDLH